MSGPDRVEIWADQLAEKRLPYICAMSGQPADVWRKFRFASPRASFGVWMLVSYALTLLCGFGLLMIHVTSKNSWVRADGFLPLTRASQRNIELLFWGTVLLFLVALLGGAAGVAVGSTMLIWTGIAALLVFVFAFAAWRVIVPGAKVSDPPSKFDARWSEGSGYHGNLVELRRVHPTFVAAVRQMGRELPQIAGSN